MMKAEILKVLGPRIKVQVEHAEEKKTASGLILAVGDEGKAENMEVGVVVQVGDYAYGNFPEKWCDLGDKVFFQRYAGKPQEEVLPDGSTRYFRILKDIDVIGKFVEMAE